MSNPPADEMPPIGIANDGAIEGIPLPADATATAAPDYDANRARLERVYGLAKFFEDEYQDPETSIEIVPPDGKEIPCGGGQTSRLISLCGMAVKKIDSQAMGKFCRIAGVRQWTRKTKKEMCDLIVKFKEDGSEFTAGPRKRSVSRMSTSAKFASTPDLCDEFEDTIRIVDPSLGFSNYGGKTRFGGEIVTVKCFEDNSMVKQLAKTDGTGKVMVVDGGGSRRRALLGDQVALDCVNSNWEGLVIYGSIRDVDEIANLNLGVQTLGPSPMKTIKRNEGQTGIPVTFGGVTFHNGECVVCDNNGIVVNEMHMST